MLSFSCNSNEKFIHRTKKKWKWFCFENMLSLVSACNVLGIIHLIGRRAALFESHVAQVHVVNQMEVIRFDLSDRDKDTSLSIKWNRIWGANIFNGQNKHKTRTMGAMHTLSTAVCYSDFVPFRKVTSVPKIVYSDWNFKCRLNGQANGERRGKRDRERVWLCACEWKRCLSLTKI